MSSRYAVFLPILLKASKPYSEKGISGLFSLFFGYKKFQSTA